MNKNISEPVITIINLLETDAKRFKFELHDVYYVVKVKVIDLKTGLSFNFTDNGVLKRVVDEPWLSEEESFALGAAAYNCFTFSTDKQKQEVRDKWLKIYCKGVHE